MVDMKVVRRWATNAASEGGWWLDGQPLSLCSIEDRSRGLSDDMSLGAIQARKIYGVTAIPTGRYRVEFYDSPKHGKQTLQLVGVKGFSNVQIHAANKAEELLGCIAPGLDRTAPDDDWIGRSGMALKQLRDLVVPRMEAGEECWIEIVEEIELDERTAA